MPVIRHIDSTVVNKNRKIKILHLESCEIDARLISKILAESDLHCDILAVNTKVDFMKEIHKFRPEIILSAHSVSGFNAYEALEILAETAFKIPFILVTNSLSDELAVEIIKKGAEDYILKDRLHRLPTAIINATEKFSLAKEQEDLVQVMINREMRYHALLQNSADGIAILSAKGQPLYVSPSIKNILGYTQDEAMELDLVSITHSQDIGILEGILKLAMENPGLPRNGDPIRVLHKNGSWRWVEGFLTNMLYDPSINGIVHNYRDVTESKEAKELLIESELFNKSILASLSTQIAVVNSKGTLVAVNKAWDDFAKANGAVSPHLTSVGSNYFEVCKKSMASDEIYAERALVGILSVFNKETSLFELEYPCHSPNKQQWFTLHVSPFGTDDTKVVISHQNVSERVIAENNLICTSLELKAAITDLEKIMDSSLDVICTINSKGIFVNVSSASQTVWGYSPQELIGTLSVDIVYEKDLESTRKAAAEIVSGIQVPIFENRYVHKSGRLVPIHWSVNWDEELQLMFCIARDNTEKKKWEKAVEIERDQFFEIFSKAPSGIGLLKGPDHIFEIANSQYYHIIGKSNLIGKSVSEVLPEVESQGFIDILDGVFTTGVPYAGKEMLVQLDKEGKGILSDLYINFIYHAHRNASGKIVGIFFFINDITEQILARKGIEKSERFFKGVIENSEDMINMLDSTGKTIYSSPAVLKKFGYTYEECLDLNIIDVIHPEDANLMQDFFKHLMINPGVPLKCPLVRERKKDGGYIWAEGTLTNFLETEGINALVANFRDVTERKKLEDLLGRSNKLSLIGSWEIDVVNKSVFWSDITKEIREVEPDHIPQLNEGISYFKEGRDRDLIMRRVEDCIEKGIAWDDELQITTHKGNSKWVRTIGEGEFAEGKCVKIYGSFQDVNARKVAELEAKKVHIEINNILESIGDGFFAVDKQWIVKYWNKEAEKLLGIAKNEIIDRELWEVFWKGPDTTSYKKYYEALETNQVLKFEDYYHKFNRWFEISAYPSPTGLSVFFKDITDRKNAEKELSKLNADLMKHASALAISNQELEDFAYVASHDLQEPLRMVTSFLSQIEKKYSPILDEKGKQYIHFAVDGAKRMRQIILDLLDFSRIGRIEADANCLNLSEIVEEVILLCQKQIKETKAIVRFGKLPTLVTNKIPLLQVFQNLISNSIKYHIIGIAPVVDISSKEIGDFWQFEVRDNGIGIEEEYFNKIFVIFQRLHNKDEYSGTGIGLAVCKKVIENLGGKIWLTSALNKGTTFYFTIPKSDCQPQ